MIFIVGIKDADLVVEARLVPHRDDHLDFPGASEPANGAGPDTRVQIHLPCAT